MKQLSAHLISVLVSAIIAIAALFMAGIFLCIAAYSYLSTLITAPLAALVVAAAALIVALIALAIARRSGRAMNAAVGHRVSGGADGTGIGGDIGKLVGAKLQAQIRNNPKSVLVATVLGGLALGVSGKLRRGIFRMLFR